MNVEFNKQINVLRELKPKIASTEKSVILTFMGGMIILGVVALFILNILPSQVDLAAGVGHYINVYGCGTSVGGLPGCHTGSNCNIATGECTTGAGEYMYKWKCPGEEPDCRATQVEYNYQGTLDVNNDADCGGSTQIDVFNHQCRPPGDPYGGWSCGANDIIDYVTWYWDSCDSTTPTPPMVSQTPEPTPEVCDVSQIDVQFRIGCNSTDLTDYGCGDTISGATPIDSVWYQGTDLTLHVSNVNYIEVVDVRCVLDPTTMPDKTLFSQGYVQLSKDDGANPDVVIGTYPINATNIDWNDIYATHGDDTYIFKCVLTP